MVLLGLTAEHTNVWERSNIRSRPKGGGGVSRQSNKSWDGGGGGGVRSMCDITLSVGNLGEKRRKMDENQKKQCKFGYDNHHNAWEWGGSRRSVRIAWDRGGGLATLKNA